MLKVRKAARAVVLVAGCPLALACSSNSDGSGAYPRLLIAGGEEGIYRLDASTFNLAGCDAEGPSTLAETASKYAYLINAMGGTQRYVQLAFCVDAEHCRDERQRALQPAYSVDGFEFFKTPAGTFSDAFVSGASITEGQCVGGTLFRHDLSMSGDGFQVESRRSMPPPFPPDVPNSQCFNVSLRDDVESGPCLDYRVYRGTFAEPL
jgi:hypothetical protein